jgi:hypothetical protein
LSPQGSLSGHAPKDQAYSQILEHVYSQLSITQWGTNAVCVCVVGLFVCISVCMRVCMFI